MSNLSAKPWAVQDPGLDTVFTNCSLVDPESGTVKDGASFRVTNGLIHDVKATGRSDTNAAQSINLNGKFVCPGLIDCHVHLTATPGTLQIKELYSAAPSTIAFRTAFVARQMLLRGFTTARDTGGADAGLRDSIAEGLIHGPRLFIAGKALSQTGGHGDLRHPYEDETQKCCGGHTPALARICDGVPQCLEAARDELRQGANFLKIMCGGGVATPSDPLGMLQFTEEEIRAITTTANYLGTYVTAHAYTNKAIRHAVDNGVRGIEHANFIDLETARYCVDKGVVFTPTLVTYETMTKPPFDKWLDESRQAKLKEVMGSGLQSLKILKEAGAMICYGSDLLGGMHVAQNGEFSIRAGALEAKEILQSATVNAAKYLKMQGKLGVVKDGAIADFLVLEKNPLEDITILDKMSENLLCIVKDGRVVASKLFEMKVDGLYKSFELA